MFKHTLTTVAFSAMAALLPLSAQATTNVYTVNLSGAQEVAPTSSFASGTFTVTVDDVLDTLTYGLAVLNLSGSFSGAHIHNAPVGVNGGVVYNLVTNADSAGPLMFGPIVFPASYGLAGSNKAAGPTLADQINAAPWNWYVNVHTSAYPGGEIRAQLAPVPEASSFAMLTLGLGVLGWVARRRRKA